MSKTPAMVVRIHMDHIGPSLYLEDVVGPFEDRTAAEAWFHAQHDHGLQFQQLDPDYPDEERLDEVGNTVLAWVIDAPTITPEAWAAAAAQREANSEDEIPSWRDWPPPGWPPREANSEPEEVPV